eukprot:GHVT01089437.1.p1 GENE.GHVT01089437.1~~GHVT01089437.1.p1  ORF type:complete len:224 (-),score=71.48 GHVT01089437.1:1077-1748(-)
MPTSPASASAMSQLGGSIVALVTPMKAGGDDAVDFEAMAALVKWHMTQKTQGIVVMGTTGEAPTATEDEWAACVSTCVAASGGALPVIAGTGTNCTASTVAKTKRAVGLGANGALVVTPYYNKPTQEGMFAHFSAVANAVAASNFPIILYNVPGRTAVDLLPETVERSVCGISQPCSPTPPNTPLRPPSPPAAPPPSPLLLQFSSPPSCRSSSSSKLPVCVFG